MLSTSSSSGLPTQPPPPPCVACQYGRRQCHPRCIYAPYFPPGSDLERFRALCRVFGPGHVARALCDLPPEKRQLAVDLLVGWALKNPGARLMVYTKERSEEFRALLQVAVDGEHRHTPWWPPCGAPPWWSRPRTRPPCLACQHLRRHPCPPECVFTPYFPAQSNPARFLALHRAFGAGYVARALHDLPVEMRRGVVFLLVKWAMEHPEHSNVVDEQSFKDFNRKVKITSRLLLSKQTYIEISIAGSVLLSLDEWRKK